MKTQDVFPFSLAVKVASITAAVLAGYFLLMKMLHLAAIVELRFFNFVILFAGISYVLNRYKHEHGDGIEYLEGLGIGFITALLTSLLFALFMFIYLSFLDTDFMTYLVTQRFGNYLNPGIAGFVIVIEGISSGAIISFAMMQLLRKMSNEPEPS